MSFRPFFAAVLILSASTVSATDQLLDSFMNPPYSARPWVYWFWMDGNISREGITADLEAMKRVCIAGVLPMEVDVGIPRGPVKFMSPQWREMFKHVAKEAQRLGMQVDMPTGPGWTGSGGPWVKPELAMQKLVASERIVAGPTSFDDVLTQPETRENYYLDFVVLACNTATTFPLTANIREKALYHRGHFSSESGVPRLLLPPEDDNGTSGSTDVRDITAMMDSDGRLKWDVPAGTWTILRIGQTTTGANTRPAPQPGLGLECDKLSTVALKAHWDDFIGKLIADAGPAAKSITSLHIDSWEMGSQNWTHDFAREFERRRGYSATRFLPAMAGVVIDSPEISERFLWDMRQTVLELICERHAAYVRELGKPHGIGLSIQPYDGSPGFDMVFGSQADTPMCEFWANCFDTFFSCAQASSIAHTYGKKVVAAEAFTSDDMERWLEYPGSMKPLGDWALCEGVNRFAFHRYAHQPWLDRFPGMTMGIYGVHYERTQTWWEMSKAYHEYLARCGAILQQGLFVADIAYLLPEASPQVFSSPVGAARGVPPDRPAWNFDAMTPEVLLTRASVQSGKVVLPNGMSYRVLVLPQLDTMTPQLALKLKQLVEAGAVIIGPRPSRSPSLSAYPVCDAEVQRIGEELWGDDEVKPNFTAMKRGSGTVIWLNEKQTGATTTPVESASWIWHDEGVDLSASPGRREFRRTIDIPQAFESANVYVTADNSFELYVNNQKLLIGRNFNMLQSANLSKHLKPGRNELRVVAENAGEKPNPAGLLAVITVKVTNGQTVEIVTDSSWESRVAEKGMSALREWKPVKVLGKHGMPPWGNIGKSTTGPEPFPPYPSVAQVLKSLNVSPDFESSPSLRYIHRALLHSDAYFIANPQPEWVNATCMFRVASRKHCQVWDPADASVWKASHTQLGDRASVSLRLEPHGSVFVVFTDEAPEKMTPVSQRLQFAHERAIAGPWDIRFQPGRGAPENIRLDQLRDLATHEDPRVRFFSGVATYTTTATLPTRAGTGRIVLDLGEIHVLARVRVNGEECGITWKKPHIVDVTKALRTGENVIEIEVANLWPNRLIGDSALAQKGRIASTTWNPFTPQDALPPSGLVGPVQFAEGTADAD